MQCTFEAHLVVHEAGRDCSHYNGLYGEDHSEHDGAVAVLRLLKLQRQEYRPQHHQRCQLFTNDGTFTTQIT